MPLLTPLKAIYDAMSSAPPALADKSPAEVRAAMHAMIEQSYFALSAPQDALQVERDMAVAVDGAEINLRLYRANPADTLLPCHVYFHGGGFMLGTLDHSDGYCRMLARSAGCAVVSVDYRLAPEHRFPTAVEDAYAALLWVASHGAELGIDPATISVGGGSAGGNLAAVVAMLARDRNGPALVAQVLEIPVTDFTSTAKREFPEEGISIGADKGYAAVYLRNTADASNPMASPLLAQSLAGLPPALVLCAEYDQLQPEGEAYAQRLSDAGVPTTYRLLAGQFHGSQGFDTVIPEEVAAYRSEIVSFLHKAFEKGQE